MKNKIVILLGLVLVLPVLMAACSGTTPTAETDEPKPAESVVIEEPTTTDPTDETELNPVESVVTEVPTTTGPRTGDVAPDFTLPDSNGNMVQLADVLNDKRMVILVFYHAYN